MSTYAIKADKFFLPAGPQLGGYLMVEDGVFGVWQADEPSCEIKDYTGSWIAPGMVDTHIHGFYNHSTTDNDPEGIDISSTELARRGTTSWLPTTFTDGVEQIKDACAAIAQADEGRGPDFCGARIQGIYLEGPFFTMKHVGAQNPAYLIDPSEEVFDQWQEAAGGRIVKSAMAAERDGAAAYAAALNAKGVVTSIGHSDATYDECIAAINAGGSTLHSFFKLPFHPLLPDDPNLSLQRGRIHEFFRYTKPQRKLLEELELIIIDEISMVRADIIDAVDRILRVYSRNLREPFGGKQLLLVGDVFQLEPVVKGDEREILNRFYPTPYFFSARVFNQIDLVSIELEKVYRQTDKVFVSVLDHIRSNTAGAADLQLLNTRYGTDIEENEEDMYITLATRRDNVDYINDRKLAELPGDAVTFRGEVTGDFPESSLPTSRELVLKPGAQVIFIKNDFDRRWVNGTIGVVSGFDEIEETLYVITDDGKECDVKPEHWKNIRYKYNEKKKEIEEEVLGTFSQFPVRLAWAITVHKSQGLTFSRVVIDFTGGVFAGGQAYVALSRCTSLEGIQLKKPVNRADIFVRPEIVNFAERFNNRQAIDRALKQAQADVEYAAATKAFDKGDFEVFLNHFFKAIHSRYDIEKPVIQRLIRRKLGVINKLRDNNDQLKSQMAEQQKRLQAYAREYYLMGNESITLAHDSRAAIANYDKALELYPEYTDAWIRKGITLFNDGRYLEAEECLTRAVKLRPAEFKAVYNRGKLRLKQQETEGAIADLDKATTLKPEHAGAHELFGDALMQAGKEVEAALQWRLAEELRKKSSKK